LRFYRAPGQPPRFLVWSATRRGIASPREWFWEYFRRCQPFQHVPGQVVDFCRRLGELFLDDILEAGALGHIESDVAGEVLVGSPLERRIWVTKIGGDPDEVSECVMKRELPTTARAVTEATAWAGIGKPFRIVLARLPLRRPEESLQRTHPDWLFTLVGIPPECPRPTMVSDSPSAGGFF